MIDALKNEFEHETSTTPRHLERVPNDKLGWQPHKKSYTAGALASHIVECVGWTTSIFQDDELNFDPKTYKPYAAASVKDLLRAFDEKVEQGRGALAAASEADLD